MIVMAVLLLRGTGIICGRIAGSFFGLHDTRLVSEASWVGIPEGGYEGINLNFGTDFQVLLPVFVLVMVVSSIKTVGEIIAIQRVSWRNPRATDFRITQVAVVANSVGNILSGLTCTVPNMPLSTSTVVTQITGAASRNVGRCIGIPFTILAFIPKTMAVVLAIPDPVMGATLIILLAILFVGEADVLASIRNRHAGLQARLPSLGDRDLSGYHGPQGCCEHEAAPRPRHHAEIGMAPGAPHPLLARQPWLARRIGQPTKLRPRS